MDEGFRNLAFIFFAIMVFLGALFLGNWMFPNDGQFFQVINMALGSLITVFVGAAKGVFHIPDTQSMPPSTVSQVTTKTTVQEPLPVKES